MADMIDTSTEAVKALMDGVTDGPWVAESGHVQQNGQLYWQVTDGAHAIVQNQFCWCQGDHAANARFIAAARDLVPALLSERNDLRDKLAACESGLRDIAAECGCSIARATIAKIEETNHG